MAVTIPWTFSPQISDIFTRPETFIPPPAVAARVASVHLWAGGVVVQKNSPGAVCRGPYISPVINIQLHGHVPGLIRGCDALETCVTEHIRWLLPEIYISISVHFSNGRTLNLFPLTVLKPTSFSEHHEAFPIDSGSN